MDRILEKEELEKLNSTDGIIEMLCGIPNFKSEMYNQLDEDKQYLIDYTMSIDLISNWQIENNLRRSLDSENLALLEKRKLIALSLLYFGKKDESGKYVTYTCPYTGKEYNISEIERELEKKRSEKDSNKRLELEHIMPHSGGGGTVLFNCLLSSVEANGTGEKGNRHLIDWFNQSGKKYYKPEKLNRIVCYMLSAYSVAYKEYKENELEFNYDFVDGEQGYTDNDDINTITKKQIKQKKDKSIDRQNVKETDIFEYKKFLDSLVNKLKEDNYDITAIDTKIKELEEQGIFKANKKYELVQSIVEDIFKEESNDTSYLTNSLKVDYYRLVDSIEFEQEEDIRKELTSRIDIIKSILKENNKSMKDYYISMKDLRDIDLLYIPISKLSDENKRVFEENIKLSVDTKINIFIDMLSKEKYTSYKNGDPDNNNIFSSQNKIKFEGYKDIDGLDTRYFWSDHSSEIKKKLEERLDELNSKQTKTQEEQNKLDRLKQAQTAIEKYEFKTSLVERINVFIDMLGEEKYTSYKNGDPDNNNIFSSQNKIKFEGYEDIDGLDTSHFWSRNSSKIKKRLEERLDELDKKENITEEEQDKLNRLKQAQTAIKNYEFKTSLVEKINVFIDMLSKEKYTSYKNGDPDNNNIFSSQNKIKFEGYEDIDGLDTSHFWSRNSSKIKKRLEERLDELDKKENITEEEQDKLNRLKQAQTAIKNYEFKTSLVEKINVFIDMLSKEKYTSYKNGDPDNNNIFVQRNKIKFEGYKDIDGLDTSFFWMSHSPEIKKRLKERFDELNKKENITEEEQSKFKRLEKAQKAIESYEFQVQSNILSRIDVFIDMLSKEKYTSYKKNGYPDNSNIFSQYNKISFEGYEDIDGLDTSYFWNSNRNTHIIPLLFYNKYYDADEKEFVQSDKDYSGEEYDTARTKVLNHLKVKSIDQYIDKLKAKNKKSDKVQNLINLVEILRDKKERLTEYKDGLLEENTNLKQEIMNNMVVTSYGR